MNGGIDNQVQERMAAYADNPDALMQKYQQDQQLIDLLALQKMKSEKEAAARQMQMAMQTSPQTIAQQREEEVKQLTQQEIAQQMGIQPPQGMPPQGMPPQGMPPQGIGQGIGALPTPAQGMAAGGIVAFAEGGEVDAKKRAFAELMKSRFSGINQSSGETNTVGASEETGDAILDAIRNNPITDYMRYIKDEAMDAYDEDGLGAAVGSGLRNATGIGPMLVDTAAGGIGQLVDVSGVGEAAEMFLTGGIGDEESEVEEDDPAPIEVGVPASDQMPESWKEDEEKEFDWDKFWKTAGAFGRGAIKGDSSFGGTIAAGSENVIAEEAARNAAAAKALSAQKEDSRANIATQLEISKEARALDELMAEAKSEASIAMMQDPTYAKAIETLTERLEEADTQEEALAIQNQISDLQKQFMKSLGYDIDALQAQKRRLLATQYSVQRVK